MMIILEDLPTYAYQDGILRSTDECGYMRANGVFPLYDISQGKTNQKPKE